jgi:hypothetical protein
MVSRKEFGKLLAVLDQVLTYCIPPVNKPNCSSQERHCMTRVTSSGVAVSIIVGTVVASIVIVGAGVTLPQVPKTNELKDQSR